TQLFDEFPTGGLDHRLAVDVQLAGGDLVEIPTHGDPMLADEPNAIPIHRQHSHGAGVPNDVAHELLAGRQLHDRPFESKEGPGSENRAGSYLRIESGTVGHRCSTGSPVASRRTARCWIAASISPLKSGWGSSGRLRSSGWAWVAMKYGWSINSMNSTRWPSGDSPDSRIPVASSSLR